jgi:hypothetical protein
MLPPACGPGGKLKSGSHVVSAWKEFLWRGSVSLDLIDPSYFLCELPGWKWLGMKSTLCVLGGYLWGLLMGICPTCWRCITREIDTPIHVLLTSTGNPFLLALRIRTILMRIRIRLFTLIPLRILLLGCILPKKYWCWCSVLAPPEVIFIRKSKNFIVKI